MKKTRLFIFITALLLTLLIVVGCDVSPIQLQNNNNLVLASISLSSSRSLISSGEDDALSEIKHFTCELKHLWSFSDDSNVTEEIYGDKTIVYEKIADDGVLGWVTPGKWRVTVYGYNDDKIPVYVGVSEVYFSPTNSNATVIMTPLLLTGEINIEIQQPMLSSNPYEYNYIYRVYDSSGKIAVSNGKEVEGVIEVDFNAISNDTGNYNATISELSYGMYSVAVYCYRNDNKASSQLTSVSEIMKGELIGGEVKKLFLCFNYDQPFVINGTLDFSDFVKADINFSSVNVSGTLTTAINGMNTSFTLQDDTSAVNGSLDGYSVNYQWYVNGVQQSETSKNFAYTFETYGPKEVSCIIVYTSGKEVYTATVKDTFTLTPSSV